MKLIKNKSNYSLCLQQMVKTNGIPSRYYFQRWVDATLEGKRKTAEITIRIVGKKESATLNENYRHKLGPTNVLSFPFEPPAGIQLPLLGDLIICAPIIKQEAKEQNKPLLAHWAHMVIHGTLHLLGYDHIKKAQATIMEGLEVNILQRLGFSNPY